MDIEFKLNREEYEEFFKLAYSRLSRIGKANTMMRATNLVVWIFIGIGFTGIFRFYDVYEGLDFQHLNFALGFWVIGILGFIAASLYRRKVYIHCSIDEDGQVLKNQKVSLTEEGIRCYTTDSEQSYSWSTIQDKEHSKNLICLYIDNTQALLIPKRSFNEPAQLQQFTDYIDRKTSSNNQVNKDALR